MTDNVRIVKVLVNFDIGDIFNKVIVLGHLSVIMTLTMQVVRQILLPLLTRPVVRSSTKLHNCSVTPMIRQ